MPKTLASIFTDQNGAITLAHKAMDGYERKPSASALDEAEKLLEFASDGTTAEEEAARDYAWGRLHYYDGAIEEAQSSLIEVLLYNSDHEQALNLLAKTNQHGDASQVLRVAGFSMLREFDRKLRSRKDSTGTMPKHAYELFDKAMKLAEIALDKFPTKAAHITYTLMASIHQERGENEAALECAQNAQDIAREKGIEHRPSFRLVERMEARIAREGSSPAVE